MSKITVDDFSEDHFTNSLPCLNRKLHRCPFCGCDDLNVYVFDGLGMAQDYSACVKCPDCFGSGPKAFLDPTMSRKDEPSELEVFKLKNQACDIWNKALGTIYETRSKKC